MDIPDIQNSKGSLLKANSSADSIELDHGDEEATGRLDVDDFLQDSFPTHRQQDLQKFVKILTCPTCKQLLRPPTLFCFKGHCFCSNCTIRLHMCPVCDEATGCGRNFLLDNIIQALPLPCKYSGNGCQAILLYSQRENHEKNDCSFKPYKCPTCQKEVPLENCENHYRGVCIPTSFTNHENLNIPDPECNRRKTIFVDTIRLALNCKEEGYVHVVKVPGVGLFTKRIVRKDSEWCLWISVAKCIRDTKYIAYKLLAEKNTDEAYVQSYSGPVVSMHVPETEIIGSWSCLVLDEAAVSKAKDINDVINMKCEIIIHEVPNKKSIF